MLAKHLRRGTVLHLYFGCAGLHIDWQLIERVPKIYYSEYRILCIVYILQELELN